MCSFVQKDKYKNNFMKRLCFWCLFLLAIPVIAQQTKTKNVVFISVDGYRWQEIFRGADPLLINKKKFVKQDSTFLRNRYWAAGQEERRKKLMPFFWTVLRKQGQLYGNRDLGNKVNVRNKYWFSYPGRSETICGYYDPAINSNDYPNNPHENVLEFVNKQPGFQGEVATVAGWEAVVRIVNRDRNHMPLINVNESAEGENLSEAQVLANEIQNYLPRYFGQGVRLDMATYAIAKTYIKANHPRFMYIDLDDLDELGHAGQYDYYLDAAHYLDAMIASLWKMLQADPFYKDQTTLVVCPDHGRGEENGWTSHGSGTPHSNETWLAVIGPDSPALGEVKTEGQIYQDQIAQTMAHLLGLEFKTDHPVGPFISSVVKN